MSVKVDVLIIAEGTYPYVRGGVSEWVHTLISNLRDFSFGIIFLGGYKELYQEYVYELPENIKVVEEYFLFENVKKHYEGRKIDFSEENYKALEDLHKWFKEKEVFPEEVKKLNFYLKNITEEHFLYAYKSWNFIEKKYLENCPDYSFTDYFWNIRNMHAPIWELAKAATTNIQFSYVLSPSTGYAGFLGSLLRNNRECVFIIHEHGIYTKERKIDLMNVQWLEDKRTILQKSFMEIDYLKELWANFFFSLGKFEYDTADIIFSLFDDAKKAQIQYGADPKKTHVLPNGIDVEMFSKLRRKNLDHIPQVVALIGRIVPIKDIKTFIKAIRVLVNKNPRAEGWIVGPEDEDPDYARECKELVKVLGLEKNIKFLGYRDVEQILPEVGLVTLTSISEGMPLVVLEAMASGIPVVSTDVGACRQLIYGGLNQEDLNIGKAGEITPIGKPDIIGDTYLKFLTDKYLWKKASESGIKRVERFYQLKDLIEKYRYIFSEGKKWQELE